MSPRSNTLFHFTKNLEILKYILKRGFWPRYCLEDMSWLGMKTTEFVAFPMVCFCDIPLSRVEEHVKFYGEFGIGLTKEWAKSNGLTPIHYIAPSSNMPEIYKNLFKSSKEGKGWESLRYLLAHTKPIEGNMVIGGQLIEKEFHQESEWRYISKNDVIKSFITKTQYEDVVSLEERNKETEKHMLEFLPKDIKYIFVKNDSDIPEIINFIQAEMDKYPSADVKVLMSRVTSLESIHRDL